LRGGRRKEKSGDHQGYENREAKNSHTEQGCEDTINIKRKRSERSLKVAAFLLPSRLEQAQWRKRVSQLLERSLARAWGG
jgi:hypothetical protein